MIAGYNIDFLIAGWLLLILVLYHFRKQKKLNSAQTRIFTLFLWTGLLDVILDLAATFLIAWDNGALAGLTRSVLTVFYLIQAMFPYFVVYYTLTLRQSPLHVLRRDARLCAVIPALVCVLIALNFWGEFLFGFDSAGRYFKGSAYLLMYGYALLYVLVALLLCVTQAKEVGRQNVHVVVEFLIVECVCVLIQAFDQRYLMTGFGIGLGLTILYFTVHNPNTYTDNVTGALDKQHFITWMQEQSYRRKSMHVLMVNVINLSRINAVFGTSIGDGLLLQVVNKLQSMSKGIRVFRVSGKRFLLAMDSLAEYEACRAGVQKLFDQKFQIEGEEIGLTVVLCGMVNCEAMESTDRLLAYLEYMAGLATRSESTLLIQSNSKIMEGFLYEQEVDRFLETAIERDLFDLNFQPVYSMAAGQYVSLEALSRLRHPTLGYVPPDVFITLAEKNGKIPRIGELQFRKLCAFLSEHRQIMQKIHSVKFNLSPFELLKPGHCNHLMEIIRAYDLPFSWFQFEVTETVATEYNKKLLQVVDDCLRAGIGLCLDDFGSGYANLNTVMQLPFSAIKLDRSLLGGISTDPHAATFYQSIVEVLQRMGYQVIAEGVENETEAELLDGWKVDMIQGYYFSKPVSGTDLLRLFGE